LWESDPGGGTNVETNLNCWQQQFFQFPLARLHH
jgi:hypothetical protein